MRAVIYAAKSTEDKHGSIAGQLQDGHALAQREGLDVVAEYSDEAASAFKGNRGPGLARAMDHAERMAPCALIVQHSDRLARGDGKRARHLVEYALWATRNGVTVRSVQDPQTFDVKGLVYAALMGDRNAEDSSRKSASVRDGLRRRKDRGAPVGPVPLGYTVQNTVIDGTVITTRIIDPVSAPTIERIFDMIESGSTFGDVARALNAEGVKGRRGKPWVSRTVRNILYNDSYTGANGYPQIIQPDRYRSILGGLARMDPAAVQRRQGGRKPADISYFLRGIGFCARCGASLYTRQLAGGRHYLCRNARQATGLCDAPAIPASLIEGHVLNHLDVFIGSAEQWIAEQAQAISADQRAREAAVETERAVLADLERKVALAEAAYDDALSDPKLAFSALRQVARLETACEAQRQCIAHTEAQLTEWAAPPDVDAALDFYTGLVDLVRGKVQRVKGAVELNAALSTVIAGMWCELDGDRLRAEFELAVDDWGVLHGLGDTDARRRVSLPQTGTQTFV
jgi:DNA invertase Pin-like site-specific DNA recombinase